MNAAPSAPRRLERFMDAALARSPAQPFFLWRASHRLTVLAYHDVRDADGFERQVRYLKSSMHPVSLDEVLEAMNGRHRLPRRAVLVTFDDGDRTVCEAGLPILREHGVPAICFVIAGLIDHQRPFWWVEADELVRRGAVAPGFDLAPGERPASALKRLPDARRLEILEQLRRGAEKPVTARQLTRGELAELVAGGVEIGNHTLSHPCLDRCTDEAATAEVRRAHEVLAEMLGRAPRAFAYPNGNEDSRAARALMELGYEFAFLFDHKVAQVPPPDPLRISRVRVGSTTPLDRFRIIVSGLHPALHHALGRP